MKNERHQVAERIRHVVSTSGGTATGRERANNLIITGIPEPDWLRCNDDNRKVDKVFDALGNVIAVNDTTK